MLIFVLYNIIGQKLKVGCLNFFYLLATAGYETIKSHDLLFFYKGWIGGYGNFQRSGKGEGGYQN